MNTHKNISEMEYLTHNQNPDISRMVIGTSLMGYLDASYEDLVEKFGQPRIKPCDKVQVQWDIELPNGMFATIYDYKCDRFYDFNRDWHVGGMNLMVMSEVLTIMMT